MYNESKFHPFPSLESVTTHHENSGPRRILIITPGVIGPGSDSSIGTANDHAANLLTAMGHDVTILYTHKKVSSFSNFDQCIEAYDKRGIKFIPCPEPAVPVSPGIIGLAGNVAYNVYEWLKHNEERFDVVHAPEWGGNLYYCLVAKRLGLRFLNTHFVVRTSSPLLWNCIENNEPIHHYGDLPRLFQERKSVEWADHVISGSHYMLNWMEQNGYEPPDGQCFAQPNLFPDVAPETARQGELTTAKELVFFGKFEQCNGIHLLLDALRRLLRSHARAEIDLSGMRVTFYGSSRRGFNAKKEIAAVLDDSILPYTIIDDENQAKAIRYLMKGDGKLAILPTIMSNSPFAIYELLGNGIPFVTSATGGAKELIHRDDWEQVLFNAHPHAIHQKLLQLLGQQLHMPRPAFDCKQNLRAWDEWHRALPRLCHERPEPLESRPREAQPFVSICLAHFNRPKELGEALRSIKALDYSNFEVVIVDDGSTKADALAYLEKIQTEEHGFPLSVYSQPNLYLGASRNLAASHAKGEYILFMDDDNLAKPNELSLLVAAIEHANADIITCFSDTFKSSDVPVLDETVRKRIIFMGADLSSGMFRNPYGDSNCLVRRNSFEKLGGFTEDYKIGRDDQEFFSRAILSGLKLYVLPEAVYWYRISENRMRQSQFSLFAGMQRVGNPFIDIPDLPVEYANILRYAQGMAAVRLGVVANRIRQASQSSWLRRMIYSYPFIYRTLKRIHQKIS